MKNNNNNNIMYSFFTDDYFKIQKNGISLYQNTLSYLGASAFRTICDNPLSAYRQFLQQHAIDSKGNILEPKLAMKNTNKIFIA